LSKNSTSESGKFAKPGPILRALRLKKGWRLADVAARTGFPVSTLSNMENSKVGLNYEKMARLSKGMDVDIGVFFAEETAASLPAAATGRRSIVRKADGRVMETHAYRSRFLAADLLNKRFVPIISEVFARSIEEFGELSRHSGEEFTYVLEGTLEIHTELYAPVRLEAGEGIYFDSGTAHGYVAVGNERCRLLTICAGEESQVIAVLERNAVSSAPQRPAMSPAPPSVRHQPKRRLAAK
jgi:transcriptional regulator with XRE-family HTH domain